jgi:signal transduction histidine kinase
VPLIAGRRRSSETPAAHRILLSGARGGPYSPRMNAVRLFSLLIYTFGVFAYGAMLALWIAAMGRLGWGTRTRAITPARGVDAVNGMLLALSFLWFVCNVGSLLMSMTPRGRPWSIDAATIFLAFCFPPVIMHVTWAEVSHKCERTLSRRWRDWLWPAYAVCLTLPIWGIAVIGSAPYSDAAALASRLLSTGLAVAFIGTAIYAIAVLTQRQRSASDRQRQSGRTIRALFGCMIAVFILVLLLTTSGGTTRPAMLLFGDVLEVVAKSLPLVFVFVGTYYENRFQFFDLFVKRGLGFVMAMAVLTIWLALVLPMIGPLATSWAGPWIFSVALIPAVVLIAWLYVLLSHALDRRWLGRRFTPAEALSHFMGALRSATTEAELIERAQDGLKDIFGADAVVTLGSDAITSHQAVQPVPIRSGEQIVGHFLMGTRVSDIPYFSEDVHLLGSLAGVFSHVLENLRLQERKLEQEQRARELSLHASRSELKALRAQINPHFLFNALNSIAGLIHRDPVVADRTIEQLADVFRYALRGAESEWAILDDEMDFVRAYLEVERARFGDRLHVEVRSDDAVRGARIPTMIVQTLVENAVKHGASAVRGPASVVVDAHAEGDRLIVSVADNGTGFAESDLPSAPRPRGGYGLLNVRQRLDGYFGEGAALCVARRQGMTVVSVTLPIVRQEPKAQTGREVAQ